MPEHKDQQTQDEADSCPWPEYMINALADFYEQRAKRQAKRKAERDEKQSD